MQRTWIALGALAGLTAVAMAALAAHGQALKLAFQHRRTLGRGPRRLTAIISRSIAVLVSYRAPKVLTHPIDAWCTVIPAKAGTRAGSPLSRGMTQDDLVLLAKLAGALGPRFRRDDARVITSAAWCHGAHSITTKATDVAGNVSVASGVLSASIDACRR